MARHEDGDRIGRHRRPDRSGSPRSPRHLGQLGVRNRGSVRNCLENIEDLASKSGASSPIESHAKHRTGSGEVLPEFEFRSIKMGVGQVPVSTGIGDDVGNPSESRKTVLRCDEDQISDR